MKEYPYKHGSWSWKEYKEATLDRNRLVLSLIEKLKRDIENHDPKDEKAKKIVNELLYHYCWKLNDDNEHN